MVRKNDDGTYKIAFNEPEGVDAAMFMNEMIWKYKMTQKDVLMSIGDLGKLAANENLSESTRKEIMSLSLNAKPEPYCPHWGDVKTELVNPLQTIFLKEGITREEAQKLLDDCANTLYDKYPDTFKK